MSTACGYHEIRSGSLVVIWCSEYLSGLWWELVTTAHPSYPDLPIAGYIDGSVTASDNREWCGNVGTGGEPLHSSAWARSCPSFGCGYGVIPAPDYTPGYPLNHDVAAICTVDRSYEGYT